MKRGFFTWEDPASAASFIWGIARTIEAEPEAATKMLDAVLGVASPEVAEAVAELRFEYGPSKIVDRASKRALELLKGDKAKPRGDDDGADALLHEVAIDLESRPRGEQPVRFQIGNALDAFVSDGALGAYTHARGTLVSAKAAMDELAVGGQGRRRGGRHGLGGAPYVDGRAARSRRRAARATRGLRSPEARRLR